jgi:hypothetical protein
VEACPFGLSGYGFDPYIATTPGNAVLALARFWADNTAETLAAEERFGDRCLRVRYEDLVTDPERIAAGIFAFLDATPAPGISAGCFSAERERFGPADYKIWYTSKISADSLGRGWSIPAAMIAPQVLAAINELAGKLGYLPVDGDWGTCEPPKDLRVPISDPNEGTNAQGPDRLDETNVAEARDAAKQEGQGNGPVHSQTLGGRLRDCLAGSNPKAIERWGPHGMETFVAIWVPRDPQQSAEHWLVDLIARTVSFVGHAAQEHSDWDVIGSAEAWEQVIAGNMNLSVALRACQLRYCDGDESGPLAADTRIRILGRLLGLANW